jgi:hypothetical protein
MQVYTFKCPICSKIFRAEEPGEPCCTGPSEMRDDHELTIMQLEKVDTIQVNPFYAKSRIASPLLMPTMTAQIEKELTFIKQ